MQRDVLDILKNILAKLDSNEFERIILTKNGYVAGVTSDGEVVGNFTPVSAEGACLIGYGGYVRGLGTTEIFGKDVRITSEVAGLANSSYGLNKVLWSGGYYMSASHTVTLLEPVSAQPHGVVLVWSRYEDGAACDDTWQLQFIPKYIPATYKGVGGTGFLLVNSAGAKLGRKYVYVADTTIKGNDVNVATGANSSSGVTWANNFFILRFVIGV